MKKKEYINVSFKKELLKIFFSWKIRIGNQNHKFIDDDVRILDVLEFKKHPSYDGTASYFDVAVLTTEPVNFTKVSSFCS